MMQAQHREEKKELMCEIRKLRQQITFLTERLAALIERNDHNKDSPVPDPVNNDMEDDEYDNGSIIAKRKLFSGDEEDDDIITRRTVLKNRQLETTNETRGRKSPHLATQLTWEHQLVEQTRAKSRLEKNTSEASSRRNANECTAETKNEKPPPIVLPRSVGYAKVVALARDNDIAIRASGSPDARIFTSSVDDFRKLR